MVKEAAEPIGPHQGNPGVYRPQGQIFTRGYMPPEQRENQEIGHEMDRVPHQDIDQGLQEGSAAGLAPLRAEFSPCPVFTVVL